MLAEFAEVDSAKKDAKRWMEKLNCLRRLIQQRVQTALEAGFSSRIPIQKTMHKKAEQLKAPVEIMIIRNSGHNWRKVDTEIDPSFDVIVDRSVQFFVGHLQEEK